MEKEIIISMGMMSENMQRQHLGQSMAYTEKDFLNLIEQEDIIEEIPQMKGTIENLNNIKI